MSISALCWALAQLIFVVELLLQPVLGQARGRNPWNSNTLEWTTTSPPPHGNFETIPIVYRGPYDYGQVEGQAEDNCQQTERRRAGRQSADSDHSRIIV